MLTFFLALSVLFNILFAGLCVSYRTQINDAQKKLNKKNTKSECPWDDCEFMIKDGGFINSAYNRDEMPCPVCEQNIRWDGYRYVRVLVKK